MPQSSAGPVDPLVEPEVAEFPVVSPVSAVAEVAAAELEAVAESLVTPLSLAVPEVVEFAAVAVSEIPVVAELLAPLAESVAVASVAVASSPKLAGSIGLTEQAQDSAHQQPMETKPR